jgi:hypothetical protein
MAREYFAVSAGTPIDIAVGGFGGAVQESWCVPGATPGALSCVELWIADGGCVFDSGDHGRAKVVCRQGDS